MPRKRKRAVGGGHKGLSVDADRALEIRSQIDVEGSCIDPNCLRNILNINADCEDKIDRDPECKVSGVREVKNVADGNESDISSW